MEARKMSVEFLGKEWTVEKVNELKETAPIVGSCESKSEIFLCVNNDRLSDEDYMKETRHQIIGTLMTSILINEYGIEEEDNIFNWKSVKDREKIKLLSKHFDEINRVTEKICSEFL